MKLQETLEAAAAYLADLIRAGAEDDRTVEVARALHAHAAAGRPGKIAEGAIVTWPPIKGECLVLHVTPRMRYCTIEYIPPKGGRITAHGIKESELSYVRSATEDDFSAHAMRAAALGRD
ncbi:MAG: hypothetical protein M0R66_06825 [Candidatus Omnitrophica bacterium]|jgi:hypothetical protein|nr:hypothetical protein [Candidatus Omnitrophota bacterium]